MRSKRELLLGAFLALATGFASPVLAQEAVQASPDSKIVIVARKDAQDLLAPTSPLTAYDMIEIAPMALSAQVRGDPRKSAKAAEFETRFRLFVRETVNGWNARAGSAPSSGTKKLILKPGIQSLQIVSGGARFWVGGLSGDSRLTLTMQFVDAESEAVIASPTISKAAGGFAGAWTFGATDDNLLNYVAETANQYLILHLNADAPKPGPAPAPEPAPAAPPPAQ